VTFIVRNAVTPLTGSPASRWVVGSNGFGGADVTDPLFPVRAAADDMLAVDTRIATASASSINSLLLRCDPAIPFDWIVLGGVNGTVSGGYTEVVVQTADSDDFLTLPTDVHNFGAVAVDGRLSAALNASWTGVSRLRVRFTSAGTVVPQITEVFAGTRHALRRMPSAGWDDRGIRSTVDRTVSKSGVISSYTRAKGQRVAALDYRVGLDSERDAFRGIFDGTDYGARHFLLCDLPLTSPDQVHMMVWDDPELVQRVARGPTERATSLAFSETAPFLLTE